VHQSEGSILTAEGYEKLKREIEHLSTTKRREVPSGSASRGSRDIAENAEYDDAKERADALEHRIATLEERMRDARVISKKDIAKDVVSVGSKVKLRDVGAKETIEYQIVGSAEADPADNKSPTSRRSARRSSEEKGRDRRGHRSTRQDEVQDHGDQSSVKSGALRAP